MVSRTLVFLFVLLPAGIGCKKAGSVKSCPVYKYVYHNTDPFSGGETFSELRHYGEIKCSSEFFSALSMLKPLDVSPSADHLWVILLNQNESLTLCVDQVSLRRCNYRFEGGKLVLEGEVKYFADVDISRDLFSTLEASGIVK